MRKKVEQVVAYVQSLEKLQKLPPMEPYHHMGATITDAVLQSGINYERVVKPRVEMVRGYDEARTTTGFLRLLQREGVSKLIK
jgi:hypothetical protein